MSGLPPRHKLVFTAGDAVKFKFQVTDKDLDNPTAPPVPRNLTGWQALSQVRKTAAAAEIEAEWEIAEPLGADGVVNMYLSGLVTQPWAAIKTLVSDVELIDPAGDPETILALDLEVAADVTHD